MLLLWVREVGCYILFKVCWGTICIVWSTVQIIIVNW